MESRSIVDKFSWQRTFALLQLLWTIRVCGGLLSSVSSTFGLIVIATIVCRTGVDGFRARLAVHTNRLLCGSGDLSTAIFHGHHCIFSRIVWSEELWKDLRLADVSVCVFFSTMVLSCVAVLMVDPHYLQTQRLSAGVVNFLQFFFSWVVIDKYAGNFIVPNAVEISICIMLWSFPLWLQLNQSKLWLYE